MSPDPSPNEVLSPLVETVHQQLLNGGNHDASSVAQLILDQNPLLDDQSIADVVRRVHSRVGG